MVEEHTPRNVQASISEECDLHVQAPQVGATDRPRPGVYIKTFGCQMNEYDTQKLYKILDQRYQPVDRPQDAALVLINTCSVREKPEQKLYSMLGELRDLKRERPQMLVGVGGCVAQQEGDRITKRSPAVDFVFGTHNLSLVPSLIDRRLEGLPPQVAVDYREEWESLPLGSLEGSKVSVYISISRGCNKNCTYCIVPTTRGAEVSRPVEEILREVRIAAHRGAREVILLGQTVNSYGSDFSPRMKFSELLARVAGIEGIERIRFTSPHPQEVRNDFVNLLKNTPKLCRHIHMPLQSGSDRILKAMNRNYRRSRYLEIIEELKSAIPDLAISTDIIVGFPGETDADFRATLEVMNLVRFDTSYSFMFSARPGTPAALMPDDVSPAEKLARLQELQRLQDALTTEKLTQWVGRSGEVLLEGASSSDAKVLQGRLSQNYVVNLNQEYPRLTAGMTVNVRIVGSAKFTLKGEPQQVSEAATEGSLAMRPCSSELAGLP